MASKEVKQYVNSEISKNAEEMKKKFDKGFFLILFIKLSYIKNITSGKHSAWNTIFR